MDPLAPLTSIGESLWAFERQQRMPGGWILPARMTVAALRDGTLLLHSPTPIDDALAKALESLGPVSTLVAPNRLHHLHQTPARIRYPKARLCVAPGLDTKRPDLINPEV